MAIVYTKNDQGLTITVGNGVPIHSANNGDRYTDLDTGKLYVYQSAWVVAGSEVGVFGISDSAGIYTYYTTLTLAMAAASSGDTIEMFADVEETGSVAITLKSGVKINGNGHTYTLSVNDNTHAIICNTGTVEMFNIKIVRTGRANGLGGYTLNCFGGTLRCQGVFMENTYGDCVMDGIAIYNLHAKGYLSGITILYQNAKHYDCIGEFNGTGNGIFSTYQIL